MEKYKNFTIQLALFDALPVIFFSTAMIVIASHFNSLSFKIGVLLCTLTGMAKVLWKIIIALKRKDIHILFVQMRIFMPIGFLLMLIGIFANIHSIHLYKALTFPSMIFFTITIVGMICMSIFAIKLDSTKARSNWIEQITNTIAQFCFLIGILLICI